MPPGRRTSRYFRGLAQLAERGKFDLFFVADTPAARTENLHAWSRFPMYMNVLEPVTLLTALAGATTRIGLGGTVSTSFSEPYNVARQFASLDHVTAGRAAWNVVTSANDYAARNFGHTALPPHALRYERAGEFVDVVRELWNTWDDDAFVRDRRRGLYFDPERMHVLRHEGKFFKIARRAQHRPFAAGPSGDHPGRGLRYRAASWRRARPRSSSPATPIRRAPSGATTISRAAWPSTAAIPRACASWRACRWSSGARKPRPRPRCRLLQEMIHPDVGRFRLGTDLEADLSDLPLDEPIPESRLPKSANMHKAFFDGIMKMIREDNPTLRQLYLRYERGRKTIKGTAAQVADVMEQWFAMGACDGFMMQFATLPDGLEEFVTLVMPELQRRGLFRTEYEGATLRDHLGLARPANPHTALRTKDAAE